MKRIFTLIFVFTTLTSILTSCSNDDDSGENSNSEIIGTWGTEWNNGNGIAVHPKFTFLSNGQVKYYTYYSGNQPELEEMGNWNINGDILTMNFPETVQIKFKNQITFIGESRFDLEEIQESGYESWGAESYFRTDDPNLN